MIIVTMLKDMTNNDQKGIEPIQDGNRKISWQCSKVCSLLMFHNVPSIEECWGGDNAK